MLFHERVRTLRNDVYVPIDLSHTYLGFVDYSFWGFSTQLFSTQLLSTQQRSTLLIFQNYVESNYVESTICPLRSCSLRSYCLRSCALRSSDFVLCVVLSTLTYTYFGTYAYVHDQVRSQQNKKEQRTSTYTLNLCSLRSKKPLLMIWKQGVQSHLTAS